MTLKAGTITRLYERAKSSPIKKPLLKRYVREIMIYIIVIMGIVLCVLCFIWPSVVFEKKFSIEYYPISKRYYPKYGGNYLAGNNHTGIIEEKEPCFFMYAKNFSSVEECLPFIDLFKEQQLKKNVRTIKL